MLLGLGVALRAVVRRVLVGAADAVLVALAADEALSALGLSSVEVSAATAERSPSPPPEENRKIQVPAPTRTSTKNIAAIATIMLELLLSKRGFRGPRECSESESAS